MRKEYERQQQYREVGDNSSQQGNCEDGVCTGSVEWWLHGEKWLWIPTSAAQNPWNYTLVSESSNDDNGEAGASSDSPIKNSVQAMGGVIYGALDLVAFLRMVKQPLQIKWALQTT